MMNPSPGYREPAFDRTTAMEKILTGVELLVSEGTKRREKSLRGIDLGW
jgi:hypothetical protein